MMRIAKSRSALANVLWPALVGASLSIPVELVGILYVGELMLLASLFHTVFLKPSRLRQLPRSMRALTLSMILLIAGYLLSDLVAGTSPRDMLRGGARVVFVLIDVLGMAVMAGGSARRFESQALGFAFTALAWALPEAGQGAFLPYWKLALGPPVSILFALLLDKLPLVRTMVAPVAMVALGVLHVFLDSRSMGAVCIAVGAVLLAYVVQSSRWRVLARVASVAALVLAVVLVVESVAQTGEFSGRRNDADTWRLAAIEVTVGEILASPFIGKGSWASGSALVDAVNGKQREQGVASNVTLQIFQAHSMLLQAWFEGGLLALLFPVLYGVAILRGVGAVWRSERHLKIPRLLLLFFLFSGLAHLLFSPFNGAHRVDVAFGVTASVLASARQTQKRQVQVEGDLDVREYAAFP